jgi:hypothetical protein
MIDDIIKLCEAEIEWAKLNIDYDNEDKDWCEGWKQAHENILCIINQKKTYNYE